MIKSLIISVINTEPKFNDNNQHFEKDIIKHIFQKKKLSKKSFLKLF